MKRSLVIAALVSAALVSAALVSAALALAACGKSTAAPPTPDATPTEALSETLSEPPVQDAAEASVEECEGEIFGHATCFTVARANGAVTRTTHRVAATDAHCDDTATVGKMRVHVSCAQARGRMKMTGPVTMSLTIVDDPSYPARNGAVVALEKHEGGASMIGVHLEATPTALGVTIDYFRGE